MLSGRGIVLPRIDQRDAGGQKVGGVARGEREVVDLGGGGDKGVGYRGAQGNAELGGLLGDATIYV